MKMRVAIFPNWPSLKGKNTFWFCLIYYKKWIFHFLDMTNPDYNEQIVLVPWSSL